MQAQRTEASRDRAVWLVSRAIATFTVFCLTLVALPASAQTLERVRAAGRINLGYLADARPFSVRSAAGAPEGYGVTLCERIVARVRTQLSLPQLAVQWAPVTIDNFAREVQQGRVDLAVLTGGCDPRPETGRRILDPDLLGRQPGDRTRGYRGQAASSARGKPGAPTGLARLTCCQGAE